MRKTIQWAAAALVLGLLIGATPGYLQLRDLRERSAATEQSLNREMQILRQEILISDAHSGFGKLLMAVNNGNQREAQSLSTRVFDLVDKAAETVENPDDRRRLLTAQQSRDAITSAIVTSDADAANKFKSLFRLLADSVTL